MTFISAAVALGGGILAWRTAQRSSEVVLNDAVVVVAGASSGIGKATAHALAAEKMRVELIARTEANLVNVKGELEAYGVEIL